MYWNLNNKELARKLVELCICKDIDILILSEHSELDIPLILSRFADNDVIMRPEYVDLKKKSIVFCKSEIVCTVYKESSRYSVHKLKYNNELDILLFSVHLHSKIYKDDYGQLGPVSIMKAQIESIEMYENNENTIIVGDFNMNPYDRGMTDLYGFNTTISKITARKKHRKVDGEEISYYFNPMWHLMGNNFEEVLGSYYYRNPNTSIDWNTFDQVIIKPSLIDLIDISKISFITNFNSHNLIGESGVPNKKRYSDHLPLFFSLKEE